MRMPHRQLAVACRVTLSHAVMLTQSAASSLLRPAMCCGAFMFQESGAELTSMIQHVASVQVLHPSVQRDSI